MEVVGERTTEMGNEFDSNSLPSLNLRHAHCYVAPPTGLSVAQVTLIIFQGLHQLAGLKQSRSVGKVAMSDISIYGCFIILFGFGPF